VTVFCCSGYDSINIESRWLCDWSFVRIHRIISTKQWFPYSHTHRFSWYTSTHRR